MHAPAHEVASDGGEGEVMPVTHVHTAENRDLLTPLGANIVNRELSPIPEYQGPPLYVGMFVDVRDTLGKWLEAEIVSVVEGKMCVHYNGWDSKWDELVKDMRRIAPLHRWSLKRKCDWKKADQVVVLLYKPPANCGTCLATVTSVDGEQVQVSYEVDSKLWKFWYHTRASDIWRPPEDFFSLGEGKVNQILPSSGKQLSEASTSEEVSARTSASALDYQAIEDAGSAASSHFDPISFSSPLTKVSNSDNESGTALGALEVVDSGNSGTTSTTSSSSSSSSSTTSNTSSSTTSDRSASNSSTTSSSISDMLMRTATVHARPLQIEAPSCQGVLQQSSSTPIMDYLKLASPDKPSKWQDWFTYLHSEDIDTVEDLRGLSCKDFEDLKASVVLKSLLRKAREVHLSVDIVPPPYDA